MIAADLTRGVLILGLLFVRRPDEVWIAYAVTLLTVSASAFFEPARTATIPNITSPDELLTASALSSAMWPAMLALGAAIGGIATALSGRSSAFVLNAISFFVSAVFISLTRFDARPPRVATRTNFASLLGLPDLRDGLRYVIAHRHVAAVMCVKAGWGLAGGVLLLLTIFGQRIFPIAGSTAAGIGVLYGARGIGSGLGPIALRWFLGQDKTTLRRSIGPAYFAVGACYLALAGARSLPLAALAVLGAHFAGSMLWTFSTVLLQLDVPDRFRGRVFAVELALVTITSSAASYVTAYALDRAGWAPRELSFALGALFAVPGVLWLLTSALPASNSE
jgi:predicted MFS family arabinose efflux permease